MITQNIGSFSPIKIEQIEQFLITSRPLMNSDSNFIQELSDSIQKLNNIQINARDKAEEFASDVAGITLNDVMVEMQKASLALHFGIQVNNKLIHAYQEIMNMTI